MTWNPVRFVETLIHFRVAGPLKSVLDRLPLVSQALPPSSLHTVLHPASPQETLLVHTPEPEPEPELRERLATAAAPLGYQVAAMAQNPAEEPALDRPLVNVPVVVWSPDPSKDKPTVLADLASYLHQATTLTEATLVDLRHPTPALKDIWGALDDVVMGGVSSSQARWNDGLIFTGNVSTDNSGGFASIRTRNVDPPINLAQWQGTVLQVQGDGQRYKWILRDSPGWDSLAYSRSFDTDAESPTTIRTGFRDMVATFRARTKPDAAPLNPSRISSMQLMLSKFEYDGDLNPTFQAGPFKLEVSRIGVFRHGPKPLVLLPSLAEPEIDEARNLLGQANLIGVVPQHHGFQVIGAGEQLPAWISQDTVKHLCQGVTTHR